MRSDIFMEQVLEREAPKTSYRVYRIYDDDCSEIKNPDMLKAIANAQDTPLSFFILCTQP